MLSSNQGAPRSPASPSLEPRQPTVMVVDDDAVMVSVILRFLSKENYLVLNATSGPAAIALLEDCPALDLLITDVAMPVMTGPQLAETIRRKYPGVPVLFQTGFPAKFFKEGGILHGRAALIEKPFTARELIDAARQLQFTPLTPPE